MCPRLSNWPRNPVRSDEKIKYLRLRLGTACCAAMLALPSMAATAPAQLQGPPGITEPRAFPAFNPAAPACDRPPKLNRELAYVQENDRQFLEGVNYGLRLAAQDRGLSYQRSLADNDAAKAAAQIDAFRVANVGALIATSSDPAVVSPSIQALIWTGAFAGTIVPPPATLLLNAPQYQTGKALADAAIDYIEATLGGKARVVLLTQDSMQYLAPRFAAMRDEFSKVPGVSVVADLAPNPVTKQGGYNTMNTILLASPEVDVVLGGDSVVLGALQALREAGKARPNQFLGGIDGEPEGVSELKKPGSPFKATIALSSPVFAYAMGEYAADWLDGKSVPQAMDILPVALTTANIAQYEADLDNPAAVFRDPDRRASYLKMYGNICYNTRDQYVNFPWSSEAQ